MSADKYPSIFSRQMVAIVYIFGCYLDGIRCSRMTRPDIIFILVQGISS